MYQLVEFLYEQFQLQFKSEILKQKILKFMQKFIDCFKECPIEFEIDDDQKEEFSKIFIEIIKHFSNTFNNNFSQNKKPKSRRGRHLIGIGRNIKKKIKKIKNNTIQKHHQKPTQHSIDDKKNQEVILIPKLQRLIEIDIENQAIKENSQSKNN